MYHKATLGVLFIIVILLLHSTWSVYKKKRSSEEMRDIVSSRVTDLRQRKADLDSKIDKLATISGVEEEIRSKFSVTKGDETMVVVLPRENEKVSTSTEKVSFWQKFVDFFGI